LESIRKNIVLPPGPEIPIPLSIHPTGTLLIPYATQTSFSLLIIPGKTLREQNQLSPPSLPPNSSPLDSFPNDRNTENGERRRRRRRRNGEIERTKTQG